MACCDRPQASDTVRVLVKLQYVIWGTSERNTSDPGRRTEYTLPWKWLSAIGLRMMTVSPRDPYPFERKHKELRETYPRVIGGVLRDIRVKRGYTLREAATRSGGTFKPSVLAAYERGERRDLPRAVPRTRERLRGPSTTAPRRGHPQPRGTASRRHERRRRESAGWTDRRDRAPVRGRVMRLRGVRTDAVTLRTGDLQVLSASLGMSERELRIAVAGAFGPAG